MRSLLVLIDGLGDEPIPGWKGLTPFRRAQHNNIDKLLDGKVAAEISICENDIIPESCSCILRLLGVKNNYIPPLKETWIFLSSYKLHVVLVDSSEDKGKQLIFSF